MLSIEKLSPGAHGGKTRYRVVDIGRDRTTIAVVEGLERAGCLLRFLKGSLLHPTEYDLAVDTMRSVDAEDAPRIIGEGGGKGVEAKQ